jgi:hypothetical protein
VINTDARMVQLLTVTHMMMMMMMMMMAIVNIVGEGGGAVDNEDLHI